MAMLSREEDQRGASSKQAHEYKNSQCAKALGQDYLKTKQADIESALVKVILAPSPYPVPGRAIRNVTARCFIQLYKKGETRTLFDTLQSFLKVTSDFKTPDRDSYRMCVLVALFMGMVLTPWALVQHSPV
jgi:hypothetical protein